MRKFKVGDLISPNFTEEYIDSNVILLIVNEDKFWYTIAILKTVYECEDHIGTQRVISRCAIDHQYINYV